MTNDNVERRKSGKDSEREREREVGEQKGAISTLAACLRCGIEIVGPRDGNHSDSFRSETEFVFGSFCSLRFSSPI